MAKSVVKSNIVCMNAFRAAVADDIASLESAAAGLEHVIAEGQGKIGVHDVALRNITKITDLVGVCIDVDIPTLVIPNLGSAYKEIGKIDHSIPQRELRTLNNVQNLRTKIAEFAPVGA